MTRNWLPIKTNPWTLGLPLLAMLWLLHAIDAPQRLNFWLYDTVITHYPAGISRDIVLVGIDEQSLDRLGPWPWPRNVHARLIEKLDAAGAQTIVFDILFSEATPTDPEFEAAIRSHGQVVLPLHLSPPSSNQLITAHLPAPKLAEAAAAIGHAHVELDQDGIARGIYLRNGLGNRLWPSLALAAHGSTPSTAPDPDTAPYTNVRQFYRAIPSQARPGLSLLFHTARCCPGHLHRSSSRTRLFSSVPRRQGSGIFFRRPSRASDSRYQGSSSMPTPIRLL